MSHKIILAIVVSILLYSCSSSSDSEDTFIPGDKEFNWTVPSNTIVGSFNLFPLAENPSFSKVNTVSFISEDALVAIVSFENEVRVYPYQYISPFECINDTFKSNKIAMTYCPITQSALCWNRNFKSENFTLRSSGYLHRENLVAYDASSDTYWSQMLSRCIKGTYADEVNTTFNFIETKWKTVKENFPNALVFTNTSISKKTNSKSIDDGDKGYGIINNSAFNNSTVHIYKYEEFKDEIKIYQKFINSENIIVVGSQNHHFITAYKKNSTATFTPVQNNFPIVMEDSEGNQWNVFGIAVDGPKKGQQLISPTGFVALGWAWKGFYSNLVFNE